MDIEWAMFILGLIVGAVAVGLAWVASEERRDWDSVWDEKSRNDDWHDWW